MDNKTKQIVYWLSPNKEMRFLHDRYLQIEEDIVVIASIVFNTETAVRMGYDVDKIEIPVSDATAHTCDLLKVAQCIRDLLLFVLVKDIEVTFIVNEDRYLHRRDKKLSFPKCKTVCLFSGGVDSLSGIVKAKREYGKLVGVLVAHADQPRGINIVNKLKKTVLSKLDINVRTLHAPPMKRYGYSQLRGFLYCMYGAVYVKLMSADRLLVTECGPTMYQPRFSPFDSVTMTTHPYVLGKAKSIIELLLSRKIDLVIPYENLTKAEVIMASPVKDFFAKTHSCISLGTGRNDGKCYGCIVRRLGSIVAGVKDADYDIDPITKDFDKGDNFVSLMRFSHDMLLWYSTMNFSSKENVFVFKKQRLFKRFALDNFAALLLLQEQGKQISPYVRQLYDTVIEKVGEKALRSRISEVRRGRYIPNFSKTVR